MITELSDMVVPGTHGRECAGPKRHGPGASRRRAGAVMGNGGLVHLRDSRIPHALQAFLGVEFFFFHAYQGDIVDR